MIPADFPVGSYRMEVEVTPENSWNTKQFNVEKEIVALFNPWCKGEREREGGGKKREDGGKDREGRGEKDRERERGIEEERGGRGREREREGRRIARNKGESEKWGGEEVGIEQ